MTEINGSKRNPLGGNAIIKAKTSGGILLAWLGGSYFLKEMSIINSHLWWPVFAAGIGVLLILRGIMIYEKTKYWSNDKGAFIGGAIFILLSLLSFVNLGSLASYWPVLVVILGISIVRR
jgi:putative Mn2+ efflux pump MntP